MPQFKRVDEQGRPSFKRVDASGKPVVVAPAEDTVAILADQSRRFPTRPVTGVDPGRNMTGWETAKDQAVSVVEGAANFIPGMAGLAGQFYDAIGDPKKQREFLGGLVSGTVEPPKTLARNTVALDDVYGTNFPGTRTTAPTVEENRQMAEAAGANAAGTALGAVAGKASGVIRAGGPAESAMNATLRRMGSASDAASRRLIQSWMPINKKSLDFGRDPVGAVRQLPAAATREGFLQNIDNELANTEGKLLDSIRRRAEVAEQSGLNDGVDVGPLLKSEIDAIVAQARPGMRPSLRRDLSEFVDQLRDRNKGTWLKTGELLAEKRILADATDFVGTDSAAITFNNGKQALYRRLDKTFDGLVPEADKINQFYSSLLEGRKLVANEALKAGNAPMMHETLFGTIKSKFPETALKTSMNRIVRGRADIPQSGGSALEFHNRRYGQFDRPSGVTPDLGNAPPPPDPRVPQFSAPSGVAPLNIEAIRERMANPQQFSVPSGTGGAPIAPIVERQPVVPQFSVPSGSAPQGIAPIIENPRVPQFSQPSGVAPDFSTPPVNARMAEVQAARAAESVAVSEPRVTTPRPAQPARAETMKPAPTGQALDRQMKAQFDAKATQIRPLDDLLEELRKLNAVTQKPSTLDADFNAAAVRMNEVRAQIKKDYPEVGVSEESLKSASGESLSMNTAKAKFEVRNPDKLYPRVNAGIVDGMKVREQIPNQDSISASFTDYKELPGVREVPLSAFKDYKPPKLDARTKALVEEIRQSGELNPIIVAIDKNGPYILEGGHRFDAMFHLGKKSFPAKVVIDLDK